MDPRPAWAAKAEPKRAHTMPETVGGAHELASAIAFDVAWLAKALATGAAAVPTAGLNVAVHAALGAMPTACAGVARRPTKAPFAFA